MEYLRVRVVRVTAADERALRSVQLWPLAGPLVAERSPPSRRTAAPPVHRVAGAPLAAALLSAALAIATVGTLLLALKYDFFIKKMKEKKICFELQTDKTCQLIDCQV